MFGAQYYHGILRKYVMAFGNLFNDIIVQRLNTSGVKVQSIAVPIAYGPKEKFLVRLKQDPNLDSKTAITLPRIGFEISSYQYAANRKLSSTIKNINILNSDKARLKSQYVPVPYDITFALSIFVKNADDGCQIVEQILPYFRPEFTTNVRLIPEMDIVVDTPVVLQDITVEDAYEGDFDTRRALVYNLNFVVKGLLFGPVSTSGVIKRSIARVKLNIDADTPTGERITVTPSAFANGAPLTSPSANADLSVALGTISANSDYGFTTEIIDDPFLVLGFEDEIE